MVCECPARNESLRTLGLPARAQEVLAAADHRSDSGDLDFLDRVVYHLISYPDTEPILDYLRTRIGHYIGVRPFALSAQAREKRDNKSLSTVSFLALRALNLFIYSYMDPVPVVPKRLLPRPPLVRFVKRADAATLGKLFPAPPVGLALR